MSRALRIQQLSFSPDRGEDEVQFLGFLPVAASLYFYGVIGGREHSLPMLGLAGFFLARGDFEPKLLFGHGVDSSFVLRHSFVIRQSAFVIIS
jgi:hypothetical protein